MAYNNPNQQSQFICLPETNRHFKPSNLNPKFKFIENNPKHRMRTRPSEHNIKFQFSKATNNRLRLHRIEVIYVHLRSKEITQSTPPTPLQLNNQEDRAHRLPTI